jgi:hypothetical protein
LWRGRYLGFDAVGVGRDVLVCEGERSLVFLVIFLFIFDRMVILLGGRSRQSSDWVASPLALAAVQITAARRLHR